MEFIKAEEAGFCFGVKRAVELAREALRSGDPVSCLGPIIHNADVIAQLEAEGLRFVDRLEDAGAGTLLIRSHGVRPSVIERAREAGHTVVDATCPFVKRVHHRAAELHRKGYRVAIVGDEGHPEVQAIGGYAPGACVLVRASDVDRLSGARKVGVIAQTTLSPETFREVTEAVVAMGFDELRIFNTICSATARRQTAALQVAGTVDIMFILGSHQSANTRCLAQLCREVCPRTYHLESVRDFDPTVAEQLARARQGVVRLGITGGASTPDEVIKSFIAKLKRLVGQGKGF